MDKHIPVLASMAPPHPPPSLPTPHSALVPHPPGPVPLAPAAPDEAELDYRRELWEEQHGEFMEQQKEKQLQKEKEMEEKARTGRKRGPRKKDENEVLPRLHAASVLVAWARASACPQWT